MNVKKLLRFAIRCVIALGTITYLFYKIPFSEVLKSLASIKPIYVIVPFLMTLLKISQMYIKIRIRKVFPFIK
jgi:hypothetical protein